MARREKGKLQRLDSLAKNAFWNPFEQPKDQSSDSIEDLATKKSMEFRDPYELLLYSKATSEATMSELFVQPILPDELQQTNEWIQDMTKQTELLPDPIMSDEEDDQEPITFYQGFRALHPKKSIIYKEREQTQLKELKAQASKKQLSINIENLTINESHDQLTELTQPSTTSKRSSRMPTSTRHQQISINNIAKVFTKLLNQRESLMLKSEDLEFKKQTSKHELNQVETFIQKFQSRKEQLMDGIKDLEIQEHELFEELEFLDQRIGDIGSQAIKVEKSILSKSSVQNIKYETNTCIAVLFINQTLRGHTDAVECLDFEFPHGRLVTGSADKTLRVWDLRTNTCSAVLEGHLGWVRACQMSNYTIISGSGDHTAKLWDLSRIDDDLNDDDDEILRNSYYGHTGGITCLQFKDNTLITGSVDKTLRQWDIETGVGVLILERDFEAKSPIYTEDEPNPLSESVFHAWDSPSKTKNVYQPKNSSLHVGGLHFWKHALAAGYGDGIIRLYDIRSGQCHRTLEGHKGAVTSVSFDDNTILSGSMDKTVKIWDLRTGDVLETIDCDGNVTGFGFDLTRLIIACSSKDVKAKDRGSGRELKLKGHEKAVRCVSVNSNRVISGGMDKVVKVWQCEPELK